jgi:hypothetical protein
LLFLLRESRPSGDIEVDEAFFLAAISEVAERGIHVSEVWEDVV